MATAAKRRRSGELKVVVPPERESGVRLREETSYEELRTIASAAQAASIGFDVCARRARTKEVAKRMASLAEEARAIAEAVAADVPGGLRRPTTSERMRWEWLASTAALIDGGPEGRLAEEAGRHLAIAVSSAVRVDDRELRDRIDRLAAIGRASAA